MTLSIYECFQLKMISFKISVLISYFFLLIGGIIVGISAKGARLHHWVDMIKHPGQTITQTHFLSAAFVD